MLGLLIFFINILVILHNVSINLISEVNNKLTISLYLKDDLSENSLESIEFLKDLRAVSPSITATFNSKESVLADLKSRDPDLVKILEKDNPLPPTITIEGVDLGEYEALNDVISTRAVLLLGTDGSRDAVPIETETELETETQSGSTILNFGDTEIVEIEEEIANQDVYSYRAQYERINNVIFILNALKYGLYFIITIFTFSIGVIVYSVIGNFVYYYRNEIYITKLVWGSNIFIYWPFSMQGLIYAVLAFLLSIVVFMIVFSNASFLIWEDTRAFNSYIFNENFQFILMMEFLIFAALGMFSGYLSSKKYLKNNS